MPTARMLPLGTVIKPKKPKPGWEKLRFFVTGYFSGSQDGKLVKDYIMTPWPLGAIRIEGGGEEIFLSCSEDAIGEVESLGAVSEEGCLWMGKTLDEMIGRSDVLSPLAQGKDSMALSYGDLPCTLTKGEPRPGGLLPLGSIVSECLDPGQKVMIIQHSGRDTGTGERHDYCICPWPQGADPGDEHLYTLNHDEITAVHFRGYENALSQEVAKRLEKKRRGSLFSRIIGKVSEW